ncbi:MAG TPA: hypothetical protein EYN67_20100 [Flavobacteriales bacterium]|nr:hypothetical protein [Flavobacteriales bacterium]
MPLDGLDDVKKMIAKNKRDANEKIRGVYLAGLKPVVMETPADTGVTRNSWFLSAGVPFSLTGGRTASKRGGGSIASALGMPLWVLNKKMFFTNNQPNITTLEYGGYPNPVRQGSWIKNSQSFEKLSAGGFSKQRPGGWVRKNLILMQNKIRSL